MNIIPVNYIGEKIVMFQPIVNGYLLKVDCQCASLDTTFIFLGGMCPKFSREYIQYLFAHPATFCKCCECKVVRIHLA